MVNPDGIKEPGHSEPPDPIRPRTQTSKSKLIFFYLSPFLILSLGVSLSLSKSEYSKIPYLRAAFSSARPARFHQVLGWFRGPILNPNENPNEGKNTATRCVLWMAPFLSGGGYSSEAWSYILSLHQRIKNNPRFQLGIHQHGDLESIEFWEGLPLSMKQLAIELHRNRCDPNETIVVCHSEPGAWYPPLFQTYPCPPYGYGHNLAVIGRTMFESDRVNPEHARRCNRMDYVWVPTDFHVETFTRSGVDPSKLVKVVQPVDIEFFDPARYDPLDLHSLGSLILGEESKRETQNLNSTKEFFFLSVFKWEFRKGWDVLLSAYLREFSNADGVSLHLLTNPYHSDKNFGNKIVEFVENSGIEEPRHGWAPIYVIDTHIAQIDLPRVYKAADAFVLPSRGEGWGRPLVEAMAMSLPVIATNWSGPLEYLTDENSYPLQVERMSEVVEGPFKGHLWAEPSVGELRRLMRHLVGNPKDAMAKGRLARKDMIRRFSPEIVAGIVAEKIENLLEKS